jgi:hypothetical protein
LLFVVLSVLTITSIAIHQHIRFLSVVELKACKIKVHILS